MGRLEVEIRDVLDCKGDIHYARTRISELRDNIIEVYKRLTYVHDNMENLHSRILEIEKRVFGPK
jgi:hypothetical protein